MSMSLTSQREIASRDVRHFRIEEALLVPQISVSCRTTQAERIAIIGAGPAGLSAANILVQLGYQVTLFEALPVVGGMLAVGIPAYRRPSDLVARVIKALLRPDIDLRLETMIGRDLSFQQVRAQFAAILLAVGAQQSVPSGIPGEAFLQGVLPAVAFLKQQALAPERRIQGKVRVIGGGFATLDAARQAVRAGAESVSICCPGTIAELPALGEEKAAALAEGIILYAALLPTGLCGTEDMHVLGVRCQRMRWEEASHTGEKRSVPVPGTSCHYPADLVIVALAEQPDLSFLAGTGGHADLPLKYNEDASLVEFPGVFAAGDMTGEPRTLLQAIAQGNQVAHAMHASLCARSAPARQKRENE